MVGLQNCLYFDVQVTVAFWGNASFSMCIAAHVQKSYRAQSFPYASSNYDAAGVESISLANILGVSTSLASTFLMGMVVMFDLWRAEDCV